MKIVCVMKAMKHVFGLGFHKTRKMFPMNSSTIPVLEFSSFHTLYSVHLRLAAGKTKIYITFLFEALITAKFAKFIFLQQTFYMEFSKF